MPPVLVLNCRRARKGIGNAGRELLNNNDITLHLIRLVLFFCIFQKVDDICIIVNPRHVNFYTKCSPFQVIGAERYHSKVNAPAVALRMDADLVRNHLKNTQVLISMGHQLFTHYLSIKIALNYNIAANIITADPACVGRPNPLRAETISNMLEIDEHLLEKLSSNQLKYLKKIYPGLRQ